MSKILITGISGFIGRKLVEKLKKDYKVIGYCRTPSNIKDIEEINDDIVNINKHKKQLKAVNKVYHLAAYINFSHTSLKKSLRINVLGTKQLLKVCQQINIDKFVFISAGATLGFAESLNKPVNETSNYIPPESHGYAYSKYLAEKAVLKSSQYFKTVIVNPSTVYGDIKANSSLLIKLIADNKLPIFFPGGTSCIDIDDLIAGLKKTMKHGKNQNRYILSTENLTYRQLINRVAKVLNSKKILFILPRFTFYPLIISMKFFELIFPNSNFLNSNMLTAFYQYRYFDADKARKDLKFSPQYKLEDSIKKMYNQ